MIVIKKVILNDIILNTLIDLSKVWEKEDNCFGYRSNTIDDIKNETIFLAFDDNLVVGYLFGHTSIRDKDSPTIPVNSKVFEILELYVIKDQRSKGIGKMLFEKLEKDLNNTYDYILLGTATKNYKAILHFYIEEVKMTFWSASLFKKLK